MTPHTLNPDVKTAIRDWWAAYPMTYAEDHGSTEYVSADGQRRGFEIGSREFFDRADATFYRWNTPLHSENGPFSRLFDYDRYRNRDVLEVGCGMGCMAMNWARQGALISAVDLNPVAIEQTRRRFQAFDLSGTIQEADGESLPFADNNFDYAYSWGVLHHTPGTHGAIAELHRVLRPGGNVGVMLYHRRSFLYRYVVRYVEGLMNMEERFLDQLALASRYGDGARAEGNPHTWPVTVDEVRHRLFHQFEDIKIRVLGTDVAGILDQWLPGLGSRWMPQSLLDSLAARWGWSLWITARKP